MTLDGRRLLRLAFGWIPDFVDCMVEVVLGLLVWLPGPALVLWLHAVGRMHAPPPAVADLGMDCDGDVYIVVESPFRHFDEEAFERQYLIERIGGLKEPW